MPSDSTPYNAAPPSALPREHTPKAPTSARRAFLRCIGAFSALPAIKAQAADENRAEEAYRLRSTLAAYRLSHREPPHLANNDERDFPNGLANYSKGLPHDETGEPSGESYQKLVGALSSGRPDALEKVPIAGAVKLANPAVQNMFALEGSDAHQFSLPVPPSFGTLEQASETVELYWMAVVRDVPFARWDRDVNIQSAIADLSAFNGAGTSPKNLFRLPGVEISEGPYISQFLLRPIPQGSLVMDQRYFSAVPNQAFATSPPELLALQNGVRPSLATDLDSIHRYIAASRPRGICASRLPVSSVSVCSFAVRQLWAGGSIGSQSL